MLKNHSHTQVLAPRISLKGTPDALPVDYDLRARHAYTGVATCVVAKIYRPILFFNSYPGIEVIR